MTDHAFYKNLGLCVSCKKEPAEPNECYCFECKEYFRKWQQNYREKNRENYNTGLRERRKKTRELRIANGLCANCGKPLTNNDYLNCEACRAKRRKWYKKVEIPMSERPEYYICVFCSEQAMPGYKVCKKCYDRSMIGTNAMHEANRIKAQERRARWEEAQRKNVEL